MIRRALLILLVALATTAPAKMQALDPSGTYRCDGTSPDGRTYQGVVQIVRNGEAYLLRWVTPGGVANIGVGVMTGNTLSVAFFGRSSGVIAYALDGNKRLAGEWTDLGAGGQLYKETLTKLAEGERVFVPQSGPVF
jgi:hypothetical protein